MTTNQATYAATLAPDGALSRRPDPVRDRVGGGRQLTNSQSIHPSSANPDAQAANRGLYLPADTRRTRPHPGDVLYWVACLGGACLLLVLATT